LEQIGVQAAFHGLVAQSFPKTDDILESMFGQGFGYTSSSFPKGKDELASIDIRLNDGGQPRMMDPRQKGGFIDG